MSALRSASASETVNASATAVDSALAGVVVAVIPAALAYFVGWAYLHYYLLEFGIGISELELGVESIFVYAAPPVFWAVKSYWWIPLALILFGGLLCRYWKLPVTLFCRLRGLTKGAHPTVEGVASFLLLILLAMAMAPLIKHVAVERATVKWDRVGVRIQAAVGQPEEATTQFADYKSCMERRALDLIFADKNAYYLLCISEINNATGAVYEVRRTDARLASVRPARKNQTGTGWN